ncbi:MAG: SURF1 family protein [Rickettsiales bacterium]
MRDSASRFRLLALTVLAGAILAGLGAWQVARYFQAKDRRERVDAAQSAPPLPWRKGAAPELYRRIVLSGKFPAARPALLYVGPLAPNGEIGFDVLRPFETKDGEKILVNVGWIPDRLKSDYDVELRAKKASLLPATVVPGERPGRFTPDNDVRHNYWFWADMDALAAQFSLTEKNLFAMRTPAPNKKASSPIYPLARTASPRPSLPHAQYALTWLSLLLILIIIALRWTRAEKEKEMPA